MALEQSTLEAERNLDEGGEGVPRYPANDQRKKSLLKIESGGAAGVDLKPVIAKTFRFDEIADAHRFLESNAQFGDGVIT
ncbi:hypothetical protein AS156_05500 [Bradyrhizobium macuxiense]|uniref:Uncharacterized protein n=1 Tax=Bradyrhizobium macuxiense TaxID=1755647 RepID=A0A109JUS0_9BRAD|nr:hypothetical protein AS156_05500 [Bradyrhizobium macuxiense]